MVPYRVWGSSSPKSEAALTFEDKAKTDLSRGLYFRQFSIVDLLQAVFLPRLKELLQMDEAQVVSALASDSCRRIFMEISELFLDYPALCGQLNAPEEPASAESIQVRLVTALLENPAQETSRPSAENAPRTADASRTAGRSNQGLLALFAADGPLGCFAQWCSPKQERPPTRGVHRN